MIGVVTIAARDHQIALGLRATAWPSPRGELEIVGDAALEQ